MFNVEKNESGSEIAKYGVGFWGFEPEKATQKVWKKLNRDCQASLNSVWNWLWLLKRRRRRHWFIYEWVSLSAEGPATSMDLCICAEFQFMLCTFNHCDLSNRFSLVSFSLFLQKLSFAHHPARFDHHHHKLPGNAAFSPRSHGKFSVSNGPLLSLFLTAPTRCTTANCPVTPTTSWTACPLRRISKRYRETTSTPLTALSISWVVA